MSLPALLLTALAGCARAPAERSKLPAPIDPVPTPPASSAPASTPSLDPARWSSIPPVHGRTVSERTAVPRCAALTGLPEDAMAQRRVSAACTVAPVAEMSSRLVAEVARKLEPGLLSRAAVYTRARADLAAMGIDEATPATGPRPAWTMVMDPDTFEQLWLGEVPALECALAALGVGEIAVNARCELVVVLPAAADVAAAARRLEQLPGVEDVLGDDGRRIGEPARRYLAAAEGDRYHYVLVEAGGDCPAGCTEVACRHFASLPGQAPRDLGTWNWAGGISKYSWADAFCNPKVLPTDTPTPPLDRLQVVALGGHVASANGAGTGAVHQTAFEMTTTFSSCYPEAVLERPDTRGEIELRLTVEASRIAAIALVRNTTGSASLGECVVQHAERVWKNRGLPKVDDGEVGWSWAFQVVAPGEKGAPGRLVVEATRAAEVLLDGVEAGSTSPRWVRVLAPGSHEIRLRGVGDDVTQVVEVPSGGQARVCWDYEHRRACE